LYVSLAWLACRFITTVAEGAKYLV
jgi:hypothetical protein